jgi:hypothetical protein
MVYAIQVECRFALFRFLDAEKLILLNELHPWLLAPGEEPEEGYEEFNDRWNLFKGREERAHLAVHDFLNHAANVSKIFFPDCRHRTPKSQARKLRGETMCELFEVSPTMEIASRYLRNAIEHFDERLEELHGEGFGIGVMDLNQMPFGAATPSGYPPLEDRLRNFDGNGAYTFRGQSIDLGKTREELESILEKVYKFYEEEYATSS